MLGHGLGEVVAHAGDVLPSVSLQLGGDARLLYSNCERIQGRVIGQLQVRLSGPLAASALVQDGWVADSILTHPLQTAETTAP